MLNLLFSSISLIVCLSTTIYFLTNTAPHTNEIKYYLFWRVPRWIRIITLFVYIGLILFQLSRHLCQIDLIIILLCIPSLLYSESTFLSYGKIRKPLKLKIGILRTLPYLTIFLFESIKLQENLHHVSFPFLFQFILSIVSLGSIFREAFFLNPLPQRNPIPLEVSSGLVSYLSFFYLTNTVIKAAIQQESLELDDVPLLEDEDSALNSWNRIKNDFLRFAKHNSSQYLPFPSSHDEEEPSSSLHPSPPSLFTSSDSSSYLSLDRTDHSEQEEEEVQNQTIHGDDEEHLLDDTSSLPSPSYSPNSPPLSLPLILWRSVSLDFFVQALFQFLGSSCVALSPLALNSLLTYIRHQTSPYSSSPSSSIDSTSSTSTSISSNPNSISSSMPLQFSVQTAILVLYFGPLAKSIFDNQNYVRGRHIGIRTRASLISAVFSHALNVDLKASPESTGKLANLISVDVGIVQDFSCYSNIIWSSLYEICLLTYLLYCVLGPAAGIGFLVMCSALSLGGSVGKRLEAIQREMLEKKDARMAVVNEILNGIRIIKFFAWEQQFAARVASARKKEVDSLRSYVLTNSILLSIWDIVPTLVATCAFLFHTQVLHLPLSPEVGFTSLTLFNALRYPLMYFLDQLNLTFKARVSIKRIDQFLRMKTLRKLAICPPPSPPSSPLSPYLDEDSVVRGVSLEEDQDSDEGLPPPISGEIELKNASFGWSGPSTYSSHTPSTPTLCSRVVRAFLPSPSSLSPLRRSPSSAQLTPPTFPSSDPTSPDSLSDAESHHGLILHSDLDDDRLPSSPLHSSREEPGLELTSRHSLLSSTKPSADPCSAVLRNLSLRLPSRQLTVVIGPTASGKSTLIAGILGECSLLSGSSTIYSSNNRGQVSFAPQTAWIQNATLRENILFGQPMDETRYRKVLFACALEPDLIGLEAGDLTEIGEKGVGLSGGQQQRVSLARAAYARSEVILMDDVLSAVDAHVAVHIYTHLVLGFLSDRTRLLVTHNEALALPSADRVICLREGGRVLVHCPPKDLRRFLTTQPSHSDLSSSEKEYLTKLVELAESNRDSTQGNPSPPPSVPEGLSPRSPPALMLDSNEIKESEKGKLVKKEEKRVGDVSWAVYWFYFQACGGYLAMLSLFLACLSISACNVFQNFQLGRWMHTLEEEGAGSSPSDEPSLHAEQRLALIRYLTLGGLVVCSTLTRSFLQCTFNLRAAQCLHDTLTSSVLHAPVGWFDSTPLGRIVNRFSQDISSVDTEAMRNLITLTDCLLATTQVVVVVSLSMPLLFFALLPILSFTGWIAFQYLRASRELKRLDSIAKSPVFVLFGETLNGLSVVRSFQEQLRFFRVCFSRVDDMNRCHLYLWLCNRWLNFRMQLMGAMVAGSVGLAVVYNCRQMGSTSAALALVYSLTLTENLILIARSHADSQMSMNGVERLQEYCRVPPEKYQPSSPSPSLPPDWPPRGEVEFDNLTLQYPSSSLPVLKDVSFRVPGGKKVGVVGRSGAGKSSLIAALFRTVEPLSGRLLIDSVNVLDLPLLDLRSKLTIVPQEPVLFQGSVRSNLDPFSLYPDESLWEALERVRIGDYVACMPGGSGLKSGPLSEKVIQDRGSNLSAGQRQLFCLARALLQRASVLILDECTASVDHETDERIQETIRRELGGVTVFCIAHRLHTVAFYDLVLVMHKGQVAEIGSPLSLLDDPSSSFHALCQSSGDFEGLREIAEKAQFEQTTI